MESLGYVLLYFLRGSLPWQGLKVESPERKDKAILEKKQSADDCRLFDDVPEEFKTYFKHIKSIRPRLDYAYLRRLFHNLFYRNGFDYDCVFDWTELKFLEELEARQKSQ